MKENSLWIAVGVMAVGALGVLLFNGKSKKNRTQPNTIGDAVMVQLPEREKRKYSPALLREYDLIVPPFKATKRAQRVANRITAERYIIDQDKVKTPFFL